MSAAAILERLKKGGWVKGEELRRIACPNAGIKSVHVTISKLRKQGHDIESEHIGPYSRGYRMPKR